MYQSEVKDVISAAHACEFWASTDYGIRGVDLRAAAAILRQPATQATAEAWEAVQMLKGEANVLVGLLERCAEVIDAIDGDDTFESESLMDLSNKVKDAIRGAVSGMMVVKGVT